MRDILEIIGAQAPEHQALRRVNGQLWVKAPMSWAHGVVEIEITIKPSFAVGQEWFDHLVGARVCLEYRAAVEGLWAAKLLEPARKYVDSSGGPIRITSGFIFVHEDNLRRLD